MKHNHFLKIGLIVLCISIGAVIIAMVLRPVIDLFMFKPTEKELVGIYEIVDVNNLDINRGSYNKYKLEFKSNGTFTLKPTPYIEVCESGMYEVDYYFDDNELAFRCGGFIMAHIDAGFGNYRIEFVIGDPDNGESIFFGKKTEGK